MERHRILLNLARTLAFLLTFLSPFISYLIVLNPTGAIGNVTTYELDNLIVDFHFFVSPLLFIPFFLLFGSYFSLGKTLFISFSCMPLSFPIFLILLSLIGYNMSAGPTPVSTMVIYFGPNALIFVLALVFGQSGNHWGRYKSTFLHE
jgi:hypothetical protein